MEKQKSIIRFLCIVFLIGFFVPFVNTAAAETIQLTYATMWPQGHPYSLGDQIWIERMEKETKGAVKIKPFWGGTLVSARESMTEATSGIADIVCISPVYEKAGVDLTRCQTAFYQGVTIGVPQIKVFWGLWEKFPEIRNEYPNMKILAVSSITSLRLMSKTPVGSLTDLKGMRIKAAKELLAPLKRFGAEGVIVPTPEAYETLQKGIIGGAFATADTYKSARLAEVVKYDINLRSAMGPFPNRAMPLKSWNKLPPQIQKIFEASGEQWTLDMLAQSQKGEMQGLELAKSVGITFIELPPTDIRSFEDVYNEEALKSAQELDAKGLPGSKMFHEARRLVKEFTK